MDETPLLDLQLRAAGKPGLFSLLCAAEGVLVGGKFRIQCPLAAGRQSFVFLASDENGNRVVVKQPAFDYLRPAQHTIASVARARQMLYREFAVLTSAASSFLPQPYGFFVQDPIIPAAMECNALESDEIYLALEFIEGESIHQLALGAWRNEPPAARERRLLQLAQDFARFWQDLHAAGWHYCDVSPSNLLVERATGRLRVLDAGSVVAASESITLAVVTPAYCTPNVYEAYRSGRQVPGTLASALPLLGKIMHFAMTLDEPLNGRLPDLKSPELAKYSAGAQRTIAAFLSLDQDPTRLEKARAALETWLHDANASIASSLSSDVQGERLAFGSS
jgi:serine/threonine protein kinase